MKIEIIEYPQEYKKILYQAGRNCYGLEEIKGIDYSELETDRTLNMFIQKLINNNHTSVLEHINISVYLKDITRSVMYQLTRHRHCSFSIKSQHFVKHNDFKYEGLHTNKMITEYHKLMIQINEFYKNAISKNVPHYIARDVLPNSCLTNIFMTTNVAEFRYIINLRITKDNIPDMRNLARFLLLELYLIMPELFDDLRDKYLPDRPDLEMLK